MRDSPETSPLNGIKGHSENFRVTERIRLLEPDVMEIITTREDPEVFVEPYTTTAHYQRHRDWKIMEYVCAQNNHDFVDDKGNAVVVWADDPDGNGYYNIPYRVVNTAGTVTAKATGTMKVRKARSHAGKIVTGQRPALPNSAWKITRTLSSLTNQNAQVASNSRKL